MITILRKLFIENWLRKLISLILAIIIWFAVDQSLTTTKTIPSVGVRVINIPKDRTITGLLSSGLLSKRVSLAVTGKKSHIEALNPNDFEVLINANLLKDESITSIDKKHLVSLNPELSIARHISRVAPKNLLIKLVPLSEEKIPVYVTKPIGQPPRGYKFFEIWPYHLNLSVSGPEEAIKKLKAHGLKLTFNLNDVLKDELEVLSNKKPDNNIVSYMVPNEWKMIQIPSISEKPLQINDPDSQLLRIDFIRTENIPLNTQIPVQLFAFPNNKRVHSSSLSFANSSLIEVKRGIKVLNKSLYTQGVSELFVNLVREHLCLTVNLSNITSDNASFDWSVQLINAQKIEDQYVAEILRDYIDDEIRDLKPDAREEYLRNRFRNYMNRFHLCTENGERLKLDISLKGKEISITELIGANAL